MKRTNIADPEFARDESDAAGLRAGLARLGEPLGARAIGISVYELPPARRSASPPAS